MTCDVCANATATHTATMLDSDSADATILICTGCRNLFDPAEFAIEPF